MQTAYITIGNTDNGLTQQEWSLFCHSIHTLVSKWAVEVFFVGFSSPDSSYQNMCISFTLRDDLVAYLRQALKVIAKDYKQKAIALAIVPEVELVEP